MNDPEHEKLDDLAARIQAAKVQSGLSEEPGPAEPVKASQTGYELVGTIIICVVIGYLMDKYLHTKPWGIIGMLLIGFVAGMMNIWRALGGYDQSVGMKKKNGN